MTHVVNLLGGTGNQLFQYLFGQTLRSLTGDDVAYDINDFASYTLHGGFSIARILDIDLPIASSPHAPWLWDRRIKRLLAEVHPVLLRSLGFHTDYDFLFANVSRLRRDQYFYGFWHGIDYPPDLVTAIIGQLRFNASVREEADTMANRLGIDRASSIALHVRLGDYLKLPKSPHLPLPADYYRQAVAALRRTGADGQIFVFSDDISLCRRMFAAERDWIYVEGQSAGADLCLMAGIGTTIVSASTFGWWAGALTATSGKRVIYPQPWVKPAFTHNIRLSPPPLPGWEAFVSTYRPESTGNAGTSAFLSNAS